MLELANTSLPNGLIAGTHGFATVAMTSGMADGMRTRLEALCAYEHRVSSHDATYKSQNPVNWFHVVLPQGEHVVGRVAACDFDYTGRTNRLARLLVLSPREFPIVGGAAVALAEAERLAQPWSGEPRYLAEDADAARRVASIRAPLSVAKPERWLNRFGPDGAALARRFAVYLRKAVESGGKPVFFKASIATDPDGTMVLGLMDDLIALLPAALRGKVAFATYPAAMHQTIHMRGAYDGDRAFAAVSQTIPWVDCDKSKVVNETALPSEDVAAEPMPVRQGASLRRDSATRPAFIRKTRYSKDIDEKHKRDERRFYVSLVVGAATILLIVLTGMWLYMKQKATPMSAAYAAADNESTGAFDDTAQSAAEEELARKEREREEAEAAKKAEAEKLLAEQDNVEEKKNVPIEPEASFVSHTSAKANNPDEQEAPHYPEELEFLTATLKVETLDFFKVSKKFGKQHDGHILSVYAYGRDNQNELVKKEVKIANIDKAPRPTTEEIAKGSGGCFSVWFCKDCNEAYWLWHFGNKSGKWFADGANFCDADGKVDLKTLVFGEQPDIYDAFVKRFGAPQYEVSAGGTVRQFKTPVVSIDDFKPQPEEIDKKIMPLRRKIAEKEEEMKKEIDRFANITNTATVIRESVGELKQIAKDIKEMDEKIKELKESKSDARGKGDRKGFKNAEEKKDELAEKIKNLREQKKMKANDIAELIGKLEKLFNVSVITSNKFEGETEEDIDSDYKSFKFDGATIEDILSWCEDDRPRISAAKRDIERYEGMIAGINEGWRDVVREAHVEIKGIVGVK